ncbi:restriction endonuclease subunit S [Ochrobactrum sp. CGA5]|uniref:restriction endonuclease subunit S n=1 Tax=Ochrobactrum sp. CGA5 TaxID=2583453 RepID=UPI001122F097|nr:restriction endonuclease subunit S [Ochrobactrum sp. CGA5]
MSIGKYAEYKMLDATWMGAIPTHWAAKRLGVLFTERREKVNDRDYPPLSVTKNGVVPQLDTAAKTDDGDNRKKVCIGDFVINSRSDRKGSSGKSVLDGSVSLINTVIHPSDDISIDYSHYLLRSVPFQEEYYKFGKGIVADLWSTNYSEMRSIILPLPPFPEQTAITTFLDRETAKIDALVNEQKRLIELLKEKRQAVISHAVTKGLDPNVKMKPSGVEWLGDVPEHWDIRKAGSLGSLFGSEQIGDEDVCDYGEVSFIKVSSLSEFDFEVKSLEWFVNNDKLSSIKPKKDFIVFPKRGAAILLNKVNIVNTLSVLDPNLMGWKIDPTNFLRFIAYSIKARRIEELADVSTVPQINNKHINPVKFALPPLNEQIEICHYIDEELKNADKLIDDIIRSIQILGERRSALISAAVTGKIDVRSLTSDQAAAE